MGGWEEGVEDEAGVPQEVTGGQSNAQGGEGGGVGGVGVERREFVVEDVQGEGGDEDGVAGGNDPAVPFVPFARGEEGVRLFWFSGGEGGGGGGVGLGFGLVFFLGGGGGGGVPCSCGLGLGGWCQGDTYGPTLGMRRRQA